MELKQGGEVRECNRVHWGMGGGTRYNCTCLPGYQGRNCRTDVDECRAPGVCRHGGTCFNTPGSFRCQCPAGFTGQLCESVYTPCAPSQCLNGGTCRQTGELSYECACLPGFEGQNCEINIDDCPGHKCLNGGTCVDGVNTYNCQCPPEWTGQFCTEDVDECQLQPNACHNGGTCFNTNGGHSCVCVNGWTGESCSENIDDCATAVCFNGATCHDRVASFYCACPMGKTGEVQRGSGLAQPNLRSPSTPHCGIWDSSPHAELPLNDLWGAEELARGMGRTRKDLKGQGVAEWKGEEDGGRRSGRGWERDLR
uniref:Notch receptor 3 n=1 Tax=Chelonoidis abingdonii TaxID=106734 RepID=A0A8C0H585_CHEAB